MWLLLRLMTMLLWVPLHLVMRGSTNKTRKVMSSSRIVPQAKWRLLLLLLLLLNEGIHFGLISLGAEAGREASRVVLRGLPRRLLVQGSRVQLLDQQVGGRHCRCPGAWRQLRRRVVGMLRPVNGPGVQLRDSLQKHPALRMLRCEGLLGVTPLT